MAEQNAIKCPSCGKSVKAYRNPLLTVDIIIEVQGRGVVLIERKNAPHGWALPGGFVDYGESLETAARREALEETGLELDNLRQFRAYSDPDRDPRHHTVSVVFTASGRGIPKAADDAKNLGVFPPDNPPGPLAFDHSKILADYFASKLSPHPSIEEA
jgi:8-oxo-dGTP diphosphatase